MGVYKLSNSSVKTGRTIYGSMLAGNSSWTDPDTGAMFPLQVITVGPAGASSVSFTNIPNTYSHLQLRYIARSSVSGSEDSVSLRFNSDSASNYAFHLLFGNGSSANASATASTTRIYPWAVPGNTFLSNSFGATVIEILDYSNNNKFKTTRTLSGYDDNSTGGRIALTSGLWQSTNSINAISITADGGNWASNSQFALYGIKGA